MKKALGHHWDISTAERWGFFKEEVKKRMSAGKKTIVQFVDEDRTLDQNGLSFALYTQIARQIPDQSIIEVRAECKLTIGVPLLRAADDDFRAFYDAGLKHLSYEQKLAAMEFVPVTSLMKKPVFSAYLDEVIRKYSQQGISLIHPSETESYAAA